MDQNDILKLNSFRPTKVMVAFDGKLPQADTQLRPIAGPFDLQTRFMDLWAQDCIITDDTGEPHIVHMSYLRVTEICMSEATHTSERAKIAEAFPGALQTVMLD